MPPEYAAVRVVAAAVSFTLSSSSSACRSTDARGRPCTVDKAGEEAGEAGMRCQLGGFVLGAMVASHDRKRAQTLTGVAPAAACQPSLPACQLPAYSPCGCSP